jgi:hypothetical protein
VAIDYRTDNASEKLPGTPLESYRTVISASIAIQELYMKRALGWIEQSQKQQEAFLMLTGESIRAYTSLLGVDVLRDEVHSGNGESELPIEDYDRLSVEEVSREVKELDAGEVEELKAYEKNNKNRFTLVERFDRSLA